METPDNTETQEIPTEPAKKLFWISFKVGVPGGAIEGDLVADSPKLSQQFLKDIKNEIVASIVRHNGGVIIPKMGEPVILACIPLEE